MYIVGHLIINLHIFGDGTGRRLSHGQLLVLGLGGFGGPGAPKDHRRLEGPKQATFQGKTMGKTWEKPWEYQLSSANMGNFLERTWYL